MAWLSRSICSRISPTLSRLPLAAIQNAPQNRVATAMMQAIFGPRGTVLMAIAIMISTFGCNNGLILAGARVYYAMARDNLFFKRVGSAQSHHVPAIALIAQGIWAAFLPCREPLRPTRQTGAYTLRQCLHTAARIHYFR